MALLLRPTRDPRSSPAVVLLLPWLLLPVLLLMYAYPRVPRCDPASIPLPTCMYRVPSISAVRVTDAPVVNGPTADTQAGDERSMRQLLAAQHRLIERLTRIEDGFTALSGDGISSGDPQASVGTATSAKKAGAKEATTGKQTPTEGSQEINSILQRQANLIQRIDQLTHQLSQSLTLSPEKQEPISSQRVTDVAVFVESGSSVEELIKFIQWLREEQGFKVLLRTHFHSSTIGAKRHSSWTDFESEGIYWRRHYDMTVTLILVQATGGPGLRCFIDPSHGVVTGGQAIVCALADKLGVRYGK